MYIKSKQLALFGIVWMWYVYTAVNYVDNNINTNMTKTASFKVSYLSIKQRSLYQRTMMYDGWNSKRRTHTSFYVAILFHIH